MRIPFYFNVFLLISIFSCSRSNEIRNTYEIFNHYQKEEGFITFKASSKMIELFLYDETDKDLLNDLKKIKHINILLFHNSLKNQNNTDNQLNDILSYYVKWNYTNYYDFKDSVENVIVKYSDSLPEKNSEMVVFLKDTQGFLVMSFIDKSSENHLIPLLKPENLNRLKTLKSKNSILSF